MRTCALALLLLFATALPAHAQIGPPQPRANPLDWSLGAAVHNVNSNWMPYDYNINRNRIYFEGSYAFNSSVEIFGRVGGSDFVINDIATWRPDKHRDLSTDGDGYPAFFSGGVRGTLLSNGPWLIGGSFEAARYAGLGQTIRWNYDLYQELTVDPPIELNLGLSLGYNFGGSILYGGPLLHFGYTKVDVRTHKFGPDWEIEDHIDALTVRDKGGAGGFFGWQRTLNNYGWNLQVEGSVLNGGYGIAVGIFRAL